jgi:hypothetical protein
MNQEIGWSVTEPSGKSYVQGAVSQIKHRDPLVSTEKTPKGQNDFIEGWNEMRQCLIGNGLMKQK